VTVHVLGETMRETEKDEMQEKEKKKYGKERQAHMQKNRNQ
jgi:hypothetical protein